jgi:hypothetical protein
MTVADTETRFFSANLSLSSSIIDESVNISLPTDELSPAYWVDAKQSGETVRTPPPGYTNCSISLSQILGRTATYLSQSTISLYTLLHYFSELQEWSDTLLEPFQQSHVFPMYSKYNHFLTLRWRDAVMIATKPFLASLARFGFHPLPQKLWVFFQFCANIATIAARETLDLFKSMKQDGKLTGITAFYRHFLLQSAGVFALSAVVQQGRKTERSCYKECIELLRQLPRGVDEQLIRDMHTVEDKLEQFTGTRAWNIP